MIDWATVRPAILALLASISDVPAANIVWEDQSRGIMSDSEPTTPTPGASAEILCGVKQLAAVGCDSTTTREDDTAPRGLELSDVHEGIRQFVLGLACNSLEQSDALTAYQYLEQIRSRLWRKSSQAALLAVNVCCYEPNDTTQDLGNQMVDDHVMSSAILQLHIRAAVSEVGDRYGWIETVTTQGP